MVLKGSIHFDTDVDCMRIYLDGTELELGERLTAYNIAAGARLLVQCGDGGQQAGIAHVLATAEVFA